MSMLEEEPLAPGEVALEAEPDPIASAITITPEPEIDTSALEREPAPVVVAAEPEPKAQRTGVLAEMIEHRTVRKQLETERQNLAPVLSRLTPELQQAIVEGRIIVKPQATSTDARNDQLGTMAKELHLYTEDANGNKVPDVDAAARVDKVIRERVNEGIAPMQQMTLNKDAQANIDKALAFATEHGYDLDTIRDTYANALRAPNGAAMVANAEVATELWYSAIGRATAAGKMPKATKAAPAAERDVRPAAIVAESTGRRGPIAGVQLTPAMSAIYKQHGMDPAKSHSATHKIDMSQGVTLE